MTGKRKRCHEPSIYHYLDELVEDAHRAILRYMSNRPYHANWQVYLPSYVVLRVLQCGGPLATILRQELGATGLGNSQFIWPENDDVLYVKTHSEQGRRCFEELMVELGDSLQKLSIRSWFRLQNVDQFRKNCANLRSLCLQCCKGGILSPILAACSGKLRTLDIRQIILKKSDVDAIANHCSGLQILKAEYVNCNEDLSDVWACISPSLQDLTFHFSLFNSEEVLLANSSLRFEKLSGYEPRNSRRELLLQFCEKLGPNLKELRLLKSITLDSIEFKRLIRTCPNVVVDTEVKDGDSLIALGGHLRTLNTQDGLFDTNEATGDYSGNLQELQLRQSRPNLRLLHQFVSVLLFRQKPNLRTLKLLSRLPYSYVYKLDYIWERLRTLEHVDLKLDQGNIPYNFFQNLALTNLNLKRVFIGVEGWMNDDGRQGEKADEEVVFMLNDFCGCEKLEKLVILHYRVKGTSEKLRDARLRFERRHVDVVIARYLYVLANT